MQEKVSRSAGFEVRHTAPNIKNASSLVVARNLSSLAIMQCVLIATDDSVFKRTKIGLEKSWLPIAL